MIEVDSPAKINNAARIFIMINQNNYPTKPLVQTSVDRNEYFDLSKLNKNKLFKILDAAETRRPGLIKVWRDDPFIELLQKTFNATIMLPMRKKHMIVIHGAIDIDDHKLLERLKKYFEADVLIPDWNGKDEIEDEQTTILLTKAKPPYQQPYNILSVDGAMKLLMS